MAGEPQIEQGVLGRYPFSELGMYIRHGKGKAVASAPKQMPKFMVSCPIFGGETTMADAREFYQRAEVGVRTHTCAEQCDHQCFMN